jgi:dienelactone hydrolase
MSESTTQNQPLFTDFEARSLTFDDNTTRTYVSGSGPAVIVMTEMPGITPHVIRFARWVRDAGFTVWMPSLFGRDGAEPTVELAGESMRSACIRREFRAFADGEASPMARWLRQLAAHAHAECGGPGVGAIGMCFTGNFALAMMLEPAVLAAVMSQPSLPLDNPAGTFVAAAELEAVRQRLVRDDLTVRAYRFEGDPFCRAERFLAFEQALGDRFVPTVLPDSSAGEMGWLGVPHSVVTTSLIDKAGQPTASARDDILAYFGERLAIR